MLGGPPLIGFIVDAVGLPQALWICVLILVVSLILTPRVSRGAKSAARPR